MVASVLLCMVFYGSSEVAQGSRSRRIASNLGGDAPGDSFLSKEKADFGASFLKQERWVILNSFLLRAGYHCRRCALTSPPSDPHAEASAGRLDVDLVDAKPECKILHLEDSEDDHALVLLQLRRGGLPCQLTLVDNLAAFEAALQAPTGAWDAVISDFNLPGFTGLDALEVFKRQGLDIPFLLISGQMGEDVAVEAMLRGASDYLLKHRLQRLVPALQNALGAAQARRERRRAETALAASQRQLEALARHLQTSVEQERAAIAREIHDDVGGSLAALRFDLAWLQRRLPQTDVAGRLQSAQELLAQAMQASQRIMKNLRPAILEQGLQAALQWQVEQFAARSGLEVRFSAPEPGLPALDAQTSLVIYRTVQEALTNVVKHAQAQRVGVDLMLVDGVLSVEVSDNGRGLSPTDLEKASSFGLRGLRERAATVGGWMDISSSGRGRGTSVLLSLPLASLEGTLHD